MGILDRQLLFFGLYFTPIVAACWVVYTQLRARRRLSKVPFDNQAPNLSDKLVKQICYGLEERCKLTFEGTPFEDFLWVDPRTVADQP